MEVDAISTDQKTRLMKSGSCFNCEKQGHRARDCPEKNQNRNTNRTSNRTSNYYKQNPKEAARFIRSILAQHTLEEEEEIMKIAEELNEEDF